MSDQSSILGSTLARRYRIEREIGHGGMSTVFAAHDLRHDRKVAIKVYPPALAAAIGADRFKREIAITSRLSHPRILPLFDSGEWQGALYYVMPLIDGETLSDRIHRHPHGMPLDEVMHIARQVAEALDHAHAAGVIHRDVTPRNILLSGSDAFLADFGIARLTDAETMTESGLPFGTAMYRSPEQASGHSRVASSSDVYSLACVVYHALSGHAAEESLSHRFSAPLLPVRRSRADVPTSVDAALTRAMSNKPEQRFESASQFVTALATMRARRVRASHVAAIAALVIIASVVAVFGFTRTQRASTAVANRVYVAQFTNPARDKQLDAIATMTGDYVVRGLAETKLLDVIDSRFTTDKPVASGASALVTGTAYRRGDTLHIEMRLTDPRTGRLLVSTDPVEGPITDPTSVAEKARQKLMGNFSAIYGSSFESWQNASLPPSYEAYQEVLAGDAAIGNNSYDEGLQHYLRAASLDTSYVGARALVVLASALSGCTIVDSAAASLNARLASMSSLDRGRVDWGVAVCHNNERAALAAGERVMASTPKSVSFAILTAITAINAGNPREAVRILTAVSPANTRFSASQRMFHASFLGLAFHRLGDFVKEEGTFRDALAAMPDDPHLNTGLVGSLAGQRRFKEAVGWLRSYINGNASYDRQLWNPAQLEICAASELAAHGDGADAIQLYRSADAWFRAHVPAGSAFPVDVICTHNLLIPAYYARDYVFAKRWYEALLVSDTASFDAHDGLGAIAAATRDREAVETMDSWLSQHDDARGRTDFVRARIAEVSGDHTRADQFLEMAARHGFHPAAAVHVDPDMVRFRPLYGAR